MRKIIVTNRYIKPNAHKKFGNYIKYIVIREGNFANGSDDESNETEVDG